MIEIALKSTPQLSYAFDFDIKSQDVGPMIEWVEGNAKEGSALLILLHHLRTETERQFTMTVEYSGEEAQENAAKFRLMWC